MITDKHSDKLLFHEIYPLKNDESRQKITSYRIVKLKRKCGEDLPEWS